jgi:hypothetical protein
MYYKAPSGTEKGDMTKFDIHPKGVLPLGSTTVEEIVPKTKPPPGHVAFMVCIPLLRISADIHYYQILIL